MKIIINTSTLVGSGVTQVAVSFLYECLRLNDDNQYYVFLGKKVQDSIIINDFDKRFKFFSINNKPLDIFNGGLKSIRYMKKLEDQINPDAVFSVFGPSWWTPKSPHLQGFANPYYIYKEGPYFKRISILNKIKLFVFEKIHVFFLNRNGKYFVSETDFVSKRLAHLLKISKENIFTVSNTCNSFFREFKDDNKVSYLPQKVEGEFRFISLCTMQDHKNLTILNKVIPLLKEKGYCKIKFILTIDDESYKTKFDKEIKTNIINIGRIPPADCPYLFNECDALFLPTLAECFTANYPEAMFLNKSIITSDLPFSNSICGDAALYFNPLSPQDIVECIIKIYEDVKLRDKLIHNGKMQLMKFSDPKDRTKKYLKILSQIYNG